MSPRSLVFASLLTGACLLVGSGANAQEGGQKPVGQYVDLAPLALPVVEGGRLRNYVFVNVRLLLAPRVDPIRLRDKEPYFRDALVRAAHRRPFTVPSNWNVIDVDAMKRVMLDQAQTIAGRGTVIGVTLTGAPAPQHRLPAPPAR